MVYVYALLLFGAITTVTWIVGVALYHAFVGEPKLREHPQFYAISAGAVGVVTLLCFARFPLGYLATLLIWWLAADSYFELPRFRALALFLILGTLSFLSRLAILGALDFWP